MPTSEQFPGQFTDEEIDEEVSDRLAFESEVDVSNIEVHSVNQIVHLKGIVDTQDDLNRLIDAAINVRGVMGVNSEIAVRSGEIGTPTEDAQP